MNVAIFTDNDFNKVNGVTTALSAVLAHAPDDIRVRVYTCESKATSRSDYLALRGIGIGIPFYSEMKMYAPPFRRFLAAARADRIDLVHFTTPGPVGLTAMWVTSRLRLPMVGSFHTDLAAYTRLLSGSARLGRLMGEYMRWPYGQCREILAPSESTRQMLVDSKIDAAKIRIWSRGVSTERFNPSRRSAELRQRWGLSSTTPGIIYVGRQSKEKGLDNLPLIQQLLRRAGVDHRLIFIGDGPMRTALAALCPDAVFTGALSADDVAVALASSDLFLFPSRTDTAGNVVLEAQACGLPVLVSDQGGPREHMVARHTGMVCSETAGFAAAAIELLLDQTKRTMMGRAACAYACARSWSRSLAPLFESYRKTLAAHRLASGVDAAVGVRGTTAGTVRPGLRRHIDAEG